MPSAKEKRSGNIREGGPSSAVLTKLAAVPAARHKRRQIVSDNVPVVSHKRRQIIPPVAPSASHKRPQIVRDVVTDASQERHELIPERSDSFTEFGEPSAKSVMKSAVEDLLISMGNRNPVNAAVWISESGVDLGEVQKCEQYQQRQRRLSACISPAKFGDVRGNVAAYFLRPLEIDEIREHDSSITNTMATGLKLRGEVIRRAEFDGSGATVFEDAFFPFNADGTVVIGSKPFF